MVRSLRPGIGAFFFLETKIMNTDHKSIFDYLVSCPDFAGFTMIGFYNISEASIRKAYAIYKDTGHDALQEHSAITYLLWDLPGVGLPGKKSVKDFFANHQPTLVDAILQRETHWPELIDESAKDRLEALVVSARYSGRLNRKKTTRKR